MVAGAGHIVVFALSVRSAALNVEKALINPGTGEDSVIDRVALGNALIVAGAGHHRRGHAPMKEALAIFPIPIGFGVDETRHDPLALRIDHLRARRHLNLSGLSDRADAVARDDDD